MKNILITGANGFIGSHFCHLFSVEDNIVTIERTLKRTKWLDKALHDCTRVFVNITPENVNELIVKHDIDTIVHFAALSTVKIASKAPRETFKINTEITLNVLEAARLHDVNHVVIQSTDKVYGEKIGATINDCLKPTEPYGTSKTCCDLIAQTYMWTYGMNISIIRPCNIYGYDLNDRIVPNTIRACMRKENPIIYTNDKSTRQFLYIYDLLNAYDIILRNPKVPMINVSPLVGETYNQKEIVEIIAHMFGIEPQYKTVDIKQIQHQSIECNLKGWKPKYNLSSGLYCTIKDFERYG